MRANIDVLLSGSLRNASVLSVEIYPGEIPFTFTPFEPHSFAKAFVIPATPCLLAVYAGTLIPP